MDALLREGYNECAIGQEMNIEPGNEIKIRALVEIAD